MNKQPVYYMQTDSRWRNKPYRVSGENTTIGDSGCGPSCAAMLIETLTGKTFTPEDACSWAMKKGYKALNQGTYYSYFVPQFKAFGFECVRLNTANVYGKPTAAVHDQAFSLLKQGYYLIACMGKGRWTSSGHYIVVWWQDGKAYKTGNVFAYGENADGETQLYTVLQAHTSAAEHTPDTAVSLYKKVGFTEDGIAIWTQPLGATDAYKKGDRVMFNGAVYISTEDNNVWSPDTYGWEIE